MTSPTSKDPDEPPELILFIMRDGGISLRQAERLFEDISSAVETTRRHMVDVRCDTKVIPLNASSEPGSIHRELEEHFPGTSDAAFDSDNDLSPPWSRDHTPGIRLYLVEYPYFYDQSIFTLLIERRMIIAIRSSPDELPSTSGV